MIRISDVYGARERLINVVYETPLMQMPETQGYIPYLKAENLQFTGSFKLRGAYNKISLLSEAELRRGLIASSAGNHAQGVAYAARQRNAKAVICMPANTPAVKVESTKELGADVVLVDGVYDDAYAKAMELQKEYGYTFIHPFNDDEVIAGQGTIALEILQELPDTDAIVAPIGGGGLISGIAFAVKQLKPSVKVFGVQAEGASSAFNYFTLGYSGGTDKAATFADGIAVKQIGSLTIDYISKYVDDIVTVSDEQILEAVKVAFTYMKIVLEGAGAAAMAAGISGKVPIAGKKIVFILSGGNIDLTTLSRLVLTGV